MAGDVLLVGDQFGDIYAMESATALTRSTQAVFVASTFTAAAGLLAMLRAELAVIAGLGVIASAYASLASSGPPWIWIARTPMSNRNGKKQLWELKLDLDTYRKRTPRGQRERSPDRGRCRGSWKFPFRMMPRRVGGEWFSLAVGSVFVRFATYDPLR